MIKSEAKTIVGWREWVGLPELGIEYIKAKVDTGARTSALHAFDLHIERKGEEDWVHFKMHPIQDNTKIIAECCARIKEHRNVTDSGGHTESRVVIQTPIRIGERLVNAEVTLTDRDTMLFRMLLGRTSLKPEFMVDPEKSYLTHPDISK